MVKEQKDIKQRIEEGEFAQSAEISASYLDEDILIIDNVKVLQNPDPVRLQMNMIASCHRGSLKANLNGREIWVEKGDIFISPQLDARHHGGVGRFCVHGDVCEQSWHAEYPSFPYLSMESRHVCEQGLGFEDE